jgi:SlyX protein
MDEARIEVVEIKVAHLERAVQELSDVLYRQQQQLDALTARNQELAAQLRALAGTDLPPAVAEKPPHY